MTREEENDNVYLLKRAYQLNKGNRIDGVCTDKVYEAAISALEQEPKYTGNEFFNFDAPMVKKSDTISRKDAIRLIEEKAKRITNEDTLNGLCGAISILWDMPFVQPIRKGHWIDIYKGNTKTVIACRCSECDKSPKRNEHSDFCPNCGSYNGGDDNGNE